MARSFYGLLLLAALAWLPIANGAETKTNSTAAGAGTNSIAATNSVPAEPVIQSSNFDLAAKSTKDPFFPLSTRQPIPAAKTAEPAFSISNFLLKGLSGAGNHRLALINNRTLAEGESSEITTPSGKVNIHCIQIKEFSVVIRADAQPETMEIFLRKQAQ